MRRLAIASAVVIVVLTSCGDDDSISITTTTSTTIATSTTSVTSTAAPTTPSTTTSPTTISAPQIPSELGDFEVGFVTLDDEPWFVAIADTRDLRSSGLMFVTDLGDLDGMLFVFDTPSSGSFWMKNTLIPLDIAFFRGDGTLVAVLEMEPCGDQDPCPTYGPGADYRYALEAPAGALIGLDPAATLER
jgi:uncharacterized membrane protein (UPF0127 family)